MGAVARVAAPMFFRLSILLSLVLALAGCKRESYSRSNSGFSSVDKKLLYDFRNQQPGMGANVDTATTTQVLSAVFPSYFSDARECDAANASRPGQMVPTIHGVAEGSFTGAGLKQSAYLIEVRDCGQKQGAATWRLAVFTAGTLAANAEAQGTSILGAYDLDGDRKDELLLEDDPEGGRTKAARLVEFHKDKLVTVEDFGQIYRRTCATDVQSRSISASALYYLPPPAGQKPRFTVEVYRAGCPQNGAKPQWARATGQ
jgi:hypothetical protein